MRPLIALALIPAAFAATPVTYTQHIAPLLFKNCASCHRPGEAAPFSLLTFDDAKKRAKLLAAVTQSGYMPPWKAEPTSYAFQDERRLNAAEKALLQEWVKQGTPQGDPAKLPPAPRFTAGWQLGKPDLIVEMPAAFDVPADGPDLYRNLVIPLNLPEQKYIRAIELRPTARKTVHHVLYFASPSKPGELIATSSPMGRPGSTALGGWALGAMPHLLPEGLALPLPAHTDLVFQYHFHPSGKAEKEKSVVGLYLADKAPERNLFSVQVPNSFGVFSHLDIPAGSPNFRIEDNYTLPVDVEAVSIGAHAHYLGKEMKMTATLPTGEVKTLLWIKDWNFAWQDRYFFQERVPLPKGTRLDAYVSWDNSEANPNNPTRPPVRIQWGEESSDEMGSVGLQVIPAQQTDYAALKKSFDGYVRGRAVPAIMKDPTILERIRKHLPEGANR
ncbi:MAG: hypothetical protein K2X03_10675 [Bryobacteraceae bacterium]|nr:hypothetical protein [Bryobacteraceae bacterium]